MMKKISIDFQKVDKKKVFILCQSQDHVKAIASHLETKDLSVQIETSLTHFFNRLEAETRPGFILISRSLKSGMGAQLPGFLQRRFKVPVLTFNEIAESPPYTQTSLLRDSPPASLHPKNSLTPEIMHIPIKASESEIYSMISGFEQQYQQQLEVRDENRLKVQVDLKNVDEVKLRLWETSQSLVEEKLLEWNPEKKLQIHGVQIEGADYQSLSLFACPVEISPEELEEFRSRLKQQILLSDPQALLRDHNLPSGLSWEHLQNILPAFENFTTGLHNTSEVVLANHVALKKDFSDPRPEPQGGFHVPVEDWFAEQNLVFNLYLWLDRSQKKVLYVKTGRSLRPESLHRFKTKGLTSLLISEEDKDLYQVLRFLHKTG